MRRIALLLALTSIPLLGLNGFSQIGYGVRSKGMGGVGAALPQDAFASATNPAGMAHICNRFDGAIHFFRLDGNLDHKQNVNIVRFVNDQNMVLPEVATNTRICSNQSLGFSIFSFGGYNILYDKHADHPKIYGTTQPGMEYKTFFLTPSWGWQINSIHSVGIAVNVSFNWLSIKGLQNYKSDSESPPYVTNRGTDHEEGVSIRLGYLATIGRCFNFGVAYQTPTWVNRFRKYKGFISDRGDFILPSRVTAGVAYWVLPCLVLAADVEEIFWTDARFLRNNVNSSGLYGSPQGPGLGWRDQTVVKVGGAWNVITGLVLRAGYNYGTAPYSRSNLFLNGITQCQLQHHATFGGTFQWRCNEISLDCVMGFKRTLELDGPVQDVRITSRQNSLGVGYSRLF